MYLLCGYIMVEGQWMKIDGSKLGAFTEPMFEQIQPLIELFGAEHWLLSFKKVR